MITAEQERNLSEANARAKKKQDRTNPMVVNIEDGRLMPNTPRLRVHPQYRVYGGPRDADAAGRLRWLDGQSRAGKTTKVVNSKEAEDTFDVGTATADDLMIFALENYGLALDPSKPLKVLRKELLAAAEKAEKAETAGADLT
jgi:hypothetical protein